MNTFNTTYNFNQGNMNFGQALLYGAFGSLTGGMGCYGGGYGMGNFGMGGFGMNGSLFSMMGMGGFGMGGIGMGCCSDQMLGAQMGMIGFNCILGAINSSVQRKRAEKAETKSNSDSAKNIEKEIKELQKKIDSPEDYVDEATDTKLTTAAENVKSAGDKLAAAEKSLETLKETRRKGPEDLTTLATELEGLKAKKEAGTLTQPEQARYDLLSATKDTEGSIEYYKDLDKQITNANTEVEAAKKAEEEAKEAQKAAIEAFNKAKLVVIKNATEEIEKKKKELEELKNKSNGKAEEICETLSTQFNNNNVMNKFISLATKYEKVKRDNSDANKAARTSAAEELSKAYKDIKDSKSLSNSYKATAKAQYERLKPKEDYSDAVTA